MMDYALLLTVVLLVTAAALVTWRRIRGPAKRAAPVAWRCAAVLVVALPLTGVAAWRLSNARSIQLMGTIVTRVATADSLIAITFDDGPDPVRTERILATLAEHDARATFFLIGAAIQRNPGAAARIAAAGHEIGNHSFSHPMMLGLSLERICTEIRVTDDLIRAAGHQGTIQFRSPYGKKLLALPYVLSRSSRCNIIWDVEPETFPDIAGDAGRITRHVLENARPGSIVLLHVMSRSYEPTMLAVPAILEGLRARGYRFVTVSELLGSKCD